MFVKCSYRLYWHGTLYLKMILDMALDICVSSFNFLNKKILSLVWKSIIHCKILVQEQLV